MSKRSGSSEPDDEGPTWAAESLPMSVRKELLERELKRMGFRKMESRGGSMQQQQQQQQPQHNPTSSHPGADGNSGEHGE
jgi:hypothetical protein